MRLLPRYLGSGACRLSEEFYREQVAFHPPATGDFMYILSMFPFTSGTLHLGHARLFLISDTLTRFYRLKGRAVFHPIGWDAFGLPAENAARERGVSPGDWTRENISGMKKQLKRLAISFDWNAEFSTADPKYYRWTQWLFLRLFNGGLAYKANAEVNWDPVDQTVLADEQVDSEGTSWRSGARIERQTRSQWFISSRALADRVRQQPPPDWPSSVLGVQDRWMSQMRDWLVSRQRRWGTPIPIVNCPDCGTVPVSENDLPVLVASAPQTACPKCGNLGATRESDTLDTFFDSSWYFLRFLASNSDSFPVSRKSVDLYCGGIEHVTSHLLYARYIHAFLAREFSFDQKSPFIRLLNQGMVRGLTAKSKSTGKYLHLSECRQPSHPEDVEFVWEKMSKSKFNGVSIDSVLDRYGADVVRLGLLYKSHPESVLDWDDRDLVGHKRWLSRVESLYKEVPSNRLGDDSALLSEWNSLLIRYEGNFERFAFNVCISDMMKFTNFLASRSPDAPLSREILGYLLVLLFPFAPFTAVRLREEHFGKFDFTRKAFPPIKGQSESVKISVFRNNKFDRVISVPRGDSSDQEKVVSLSSEKDFDRVIFREGRMVNFITNGKP